MTRNPRTGPWSWRQAAVLAIVAGAAGCTSTQGVPELAEWRLVDEQRFGGGADDPDGLSQLKGLIVTEAGAVWVLEGSTHDIRVYDAAGVSVRRIGRKGQGPGEFTWPDGMAQAPDGAVWVHDAQNGRFAVYAESGELLRHQAAPSGGYGWLWSGGIGRDGRVWDALIEAWNPESGPRFRRAAADWSRVDTVTVPQCSPSGWDPLESRFWKPLEEGSRAGRYSIEIPFYPRPVGAIDWAGGALWCAPDGASYQLVKLDLERHDTLARVVGRADPVGVTAAERDSAIAELREFLERMGAPEEDWSRIPATRPLVAAAVVDDSGRLWVARSTAGPGSAFDLYTADGQPLGTVRTAHAINWRVAPVARGSLVWLPATDPDGVPYILRGRLEPVSR